MRAAGDAASDPKRAGDAASDPKRAAACIAVAPRGDFRTAVTRGGVTALAADSILPAPGVEGATPLNPATAPPRGEVGAPFVALALDAIARLFTNSSSLLKRSVIMSAHATTHNQPGQLKASQSQNLANRRARKSVQ